jgi:vesicle coat complex subunit
MSFPKLKGEHFILNEELNSNDPVIKKDALKKVIVYMSVGKDVSPIFQSVIKCIELDDIEIKKLIYLYIINYSRSRPNDAIMIINQFCRVSTIFAFYCRV